MIIHEPQIIDEGNEICVSAKIELQKQGVSMPDELWWRFKSKFREYVTDRSDAFAVAMLPVAMIIGENLEIRGEISPRLAFGMREYQEIMHTCWPKIFNVVDITYEKYEEAKQIHNKGAVGLAFSGGVDSCCSLLRHLPENEKIPNYRITHCLIIDNYENNVDQETFRKMQEVYEPMVGNLGIELVAMRTNVRDVRLSAISDPFSAKSYGTVVTAPALLLGNLFSHFYLAGSTQFNAKYTPSGSDPLFDHLLSTETMQTIHDNTNISRADKISLISKWPETFSRLRVCSKITKVNEQGYIENCCKCGKCVRTMTTLEILGVLPKYITFPHKLRHQQIRRNFSRHHDNVFYAKENLELAKKMGRSDIAFDIRCAMLVSKTARRLMGGFGS